MQVGKPMGDVIHLPARAETVELYKAVKTYGTFGPMSVTLARSTMTEPTCLALCLDGLPEGVGFEVLGRAHNSPEGITLADHMAHAVTMALMHTYEGGEA